MGLIDTLFGTYSERQVKKLMSTVARVEALEDKYKKMTDDELKKQTDRLKARLREGEKLDDILPDAFAVVREADDRVLSKRPFKVQIIGGIVIHQGRIAEMKTGEGKTLMATMPAYLNALAGKGVHIITVNDYLARVGAEEMGRVYAFLGLKTGLVVHGMDKNQKKEAYNADITYGTNNEFGFDYLRDNMVVYKEEMVQRGHNFAIVDEVDSILIDEARTPLIISGQGEKSTMLYDLADRLVKTLTCYKVKEMDDKDDMEEIEEDYLVDEKAKNAVLTAVGVKRAEEYFHLDNLSDPANSTISHHINQALHAHGCMQRDDDYVVKDGQVIIVDSFTGRLMPGRRFSDGLHQAIEAKEHVKIERESKTLATITFQNYFRLYKKLSGMTGTALTEEEEFREIYNLDVVVIPTNKPMIRIDHPDAVYKNTRGKFNAIIAQIKECHAKGQPVLVGTVSVEKSEYLSQLLKREGVPHTVLNAKYHEKEAEIVAEAGKRGAVTISTNMAGRGTDIQLGGNPEFYAKREMRQMGYPEEVIIDATGTAVTVSEEVMAARAVFNDLNKKYKEQIAPEAKEVCELGGLFIIGTERHESRRIDNQLRGRAGRQGDPGESRFYLSFEDDLMRLFGSERISGMVEKLGLEEDQQIDAKILSNSIENAQKKLESMNFERRKYVLTYDDVMNQQRAVIYAQRGEVLDGLDIRDKIRKMMSQTIEHTVNSFTTQEVADDWNFDGLRTYFYGTLCRDEDFHYTADDYNTLTREDLIKVLQDRCDKLYAQKEEMFGTEQMREIERVVLLKNVDAKWMDHLDAMDELKGTIRLQAYAHRNPVTEFRLQSGDMFDEMIAAIREDTTRTLLSIVPRPNQEIKREKVAKETSEGFEGAETQARAPQRAQTPKNANGEKVGRNDPCPCGSGKKYKKCCGYNPNDPNN
ncbi:MAG: preprotein translocase subunit SecA [Clostridia bacterium]|nr:preprotein translocase subunit SecA [Clostridia bacterium]